MTGVEQSSSRGQAMTWWYYVGARQGHPVCGGGTRLAVLYNSHEKRGLAPKLQSYWEGPYTILQ